MNPYLIGTVDTAQAAAFLGIEQNALKVLRTNGTGPACKVIDGLARYSFYDLHAYLYAQTMPAVLTDRERADRRGKLSRLTRSTSMFYGD